MILNKYGEITNERWSKLYKFYDNIELDEYIIMPDHVHGLIDIVKKDRRVTLSKIIKKYKEQITRQIHKDYHDYSFQWKRSYHDHIILNEAELENIRNYIENNPKEWEKKKFKKSPPVRTDQFGRLVA